jgi:o-succinylbenzoate synthase
MNQEFYIKEVMLKRVKMKLKNPFKTSFGTIQDKEFFVLKTIDEDGFHGWGESVAFVSPWYTEETLQTTEHMLEDFLLPLLFQSPLTHPSELLNRFSVIRRNQMAKAAIEGAVWDLYARRQKASLSKVLGGVRDTIDVGVSLGIQKDVDDLLSLIASYVEKGYKRVKVKIKPGWDVAIIEEIRKHFPDLPLMADANSAYSLKDIDHLKKLDAFNLLMIEQPLGYDDMIDHATLQAKMKTPVCLDESICSFEDAYKAIQIRACKVINIKAGRVGGLEASKRIHDYCLEKHVPVWCGGMLEAGIGRGHNIALSSLEHFTIPGDLSASSHYWEEDIISPEVLVENGQVVVPKSEGFGFEINASVLDRHTVSEKIIKNNG